MLSALWNRWSRIYWWIVNTSARVYSWPFIQVPAFRHRALLVLSLWLPQFVLFLKVQHAALAVCPWVYPLFLVAAWFHGAIVGKTALLVYQDGEAKREARQENP